MKLIKLGIGNIDPTVGAFSSNTATLIAMAKQMAAAGCTIGSFSEGTIPGYPAEDLVLWPSFVDGQWQQLRDFAAATSELPTAFSVGLTVRSEGHLYNAVAMVFKGSILGLVPKEKLAAGGVFYDDRTFSGGRPGLQGKIDGVPFGDILFEFPFGRVALQICEDVWSADGPTGRQAFNGAELIINHSASPWRAGVVKTREELLMTRSYETQVCLAYVNQIGANDGLVFDGGGYIAQNGRLVTKCDRWRIGFDAWVIDLERTRQQRLENHTWQSDADRYRRSRAPMSVVVCDNDPQRPTESEYPHQQSDLVFVPASVIPPDPQAEYFEDLLQAMKWALKDYFEKTGVFRRIGISLSGGKDSALTAIVSWLYAQERCTNREDIRDFIHCFSFPTKYNSVTTKSIAQQLCDELGLMFREIPIDDLVSNQRQKVQTMLGPEIELTKNTQQNIQARIRAELMWNWSNTSEGMFLQPGNMSEKAVGYTTIGGDLMGVYSLIGNLPKTVITELLRYVQRKYNWNFLQLLLATKPSAELAAGQEDERDLMPYPVLDAMLNFFAEKKMSAHELYQAVRGKWTDDELRAMCPEFQSPMLLAWTKLFLRSFFGSIFKWVQAPPTAHLGPTDLDRERAFQIPIVQKVEWLAMDRLERH